MRRLMTNPVARSIICTCCTLAVVISAAPPKCPPTVAPLPKCSAFCTAPPNTCARCSRGPDVTDAPVPPSPMPGKPNPGGNYNSTCWSNATLHWSSKCSAKIWGRPAIGADAIYVGSNDGKLYSLNRQNGSVRWTFATGDKIWMGPVVYEINGATTILAGSCDNSTYALDVNGNVTWKFAAEGCVFGSPAVSQKGEVWTASFDRSVYGLHANGTLKCRFVTGQKGSIIWASPVLSHDGSTVYIGSSGIPSDGKPPPPGFRAVYAINTEDCTQKWNYTTGMWIRSSATVASDGAVVVGSYDDHVYCFEADGSVRWTFATGVFAGYASNHPPGFVLASPTIDEARQVVYVGATDKCFYALDLKTGTKQWRFCTFGFIQSSAVVSPEDGSVVFGSNDYNVYSLHANNGSVKWIWRTGGWVQSSPAVDAERRAAVIGDAAGFVWALGW